MAETIGIGDEMFTDYTITKKLPGVDVVESINVTSLDWSHCRSQARAKRRHAMGIPQRVRRVPAAYMINGVLHIHPDMARRMHEHLASKVKEQTERALFGSMFI